MTTNNLRIAVDHDSTLAATSAVEFELMLGPDHGYTYDDVETWEWGLNEFGTARYLSSLWHAWTLRPMHVPLMESGLEETMAGLSDFGEVDVVSAYPDHMGITDGKRRWLDKHGLQDYDLVHVDPDTSKAELDYDIYIDDKPGLPEAVLTENPRADVYLIDHAYNQEAGGEYHRVADVYTAYKMIEDDIISEALKNENYAD